MTSANRVRRHGGWSSETAAIDLPATRTSQAIAGQARDDALRVIGLGVVHCEQSEACEIVRALAWLAGSPAGEVTVDRDVYLAAGPGWTIQVEHERGELIDGAGPFSGLPRWRCLLVTAATAPADSLASHLQAYLRTFTRAELQRIETLNPMVRKLADRQAAAGPLRGVNLVFRDHMLIEKYNLVAGMRRCGLSPERTWIVRKADPTRYAERVATQLASEGFRIADVSVPLSAVAARIAAGGSSASWIVLDDGGELTLALRRHAGLDLRLIESTSKGARVLRDAGLDGRFLDIAGSTVKLKLNHVIAVSCVLRFAEITRHYRRDGARCHVAGFGGLGQHVASLLRELGMAVTVSDVQAARREQAVACGFRSYPDAAAALGELPHGFVFGCSGCRIIGSRELALLESDAVLVSVSSQDLQPALDWLRDHAAAERVDGVGTRFRTATCSWTVVADGHAVNLFLSEGVSELEYDPFTTLLLAAVIGSATTPSAEVNIAMLCAQIDGLAHEVRREGSGGG
jgi:S-adenosylhomocysteine hydrolase